MSVRVGEVVRDRPTQDGCAVDNRERVKGELCIIGETVEWNGMECTRQDTRTRRIARDPVGGSREGRPHQGVMVGVRGTDPRPGCDRDHEALPVKLCHHEN